MPDPGYYSALFQDTLEIRQSQQQDALAQERLQKIGMERQQMQMQQQERGLMMQAFQGGSQTRAGLQQASDLEEQASKMSATAQRLMRMGFVKDGLAMQKEAGALRTQKGMQDLHNTEAVQKKLELRGQVAMTVNDQGSLNDAIGELAKVGDIVPPKYRQWGPEAQKWWESMANSSKKGMADLRLRDAEQRLQIQALEEERKREHDKATGQHQDAADARARLKMLEKEHPEEPGMWATDEETTQYKEYQQDLKDLRKQVYGGTASRKPAETSQDAAAREWAKANPNDPRSKRILEKLNGL
jgi:hypothetical protein